MPYGRVIWSDPRRGEVVRGGMPPPLRDLPVPQRAWPLVWPSVEEQRTHEKSQPSPTCPSGKTEFGVSKRLR